MNTIIEKLKAIIRLQIKRENLNFAALGGGGQTWNIETLEWVLKRLSDLEKECQWSAEDETKIAYICDVMSGKELVSDISPSYRSEIIEFAKSLRPAKVKSEKPTTAEGLEEEIDRFEDWMETYNQADYPTSFTTRDIARHFAQWQKEQMMNEAVKGEITKDNRGNNVLRVGLFNNGFEIGDKVRIIIVKED